MEICFNRTRRVDNPNDGKVLEDATWKALQNIHQTHGAFVHRFLDTKAARTLVAATPGDYLMIRNGIPVLIECKSTSLGTPLKQMIRKSSVSKRQMARHRMWIKAEGASIYLHFNLKTGVLNAYKGQDVVDAVLSISNVLDPWWSGRLEDLEIFLLGKFK
jgi:hypothetical protein